MKVISIKVCLTDKHTEEKARFGKFYPEVLTKAGLSEKNVRNVNVAD